jgi:hypothetical protein
MGSVSILNTTTFGPAIGCIILANLEQHPVNIWSQNSQLEVGPGIFLGRCGLGNFQD